MKCYSVTKKGSGKANLSTIIEDLIKKKCPKFGFWSFIIILTHPCNSVLLPP